MNAETPLRTRPRGLLHLLLLLAIARIRLGLDHCRRGASPGVQESELPSVLAAARQRLLDVGRRSSAGMTTAEYAVGTLAACAFAAVLIAVVRSPAVKSALAAVIQSALSIAS